MLRFLKSSSGTVHHFPEPTIDDDSEACTISLTVWRKSLVFGCSGFTVIGSDGSLVYRVDNYSDGHPRRLILMGGSGDSVFTICRHQKLRLLDSSWLLYDGEDGGKSCSNSSKKPIFHVRKNTNNFLKTKQDHVLAHVYNTGISDKRCAYMIEGSYTNRSCKILDAESRRVVAEIKPKPAVNGGVTFGSEIFVLVVKSDIGPGLAMSIVLLLDQMFS